MLTLLDPHIDVVVLLLGHAEMLYLGQSQILFFKDCLKWDFHLWVPQDVVYPVLQKLLEPLNESVPLVYCLLGIIFLPLVRFTSNIILICDPAE